MAKVLCVAGPTACGKTKMGVALAHRFDGEVVSVDSMQIYRDLTVGTAAPTADEMEGVPHHMIGVADVAESWSVARYVERADACIQDILARGKLPVLVGGTGLWLDALIRGSEFAPGQQGGAIRLGLQQRVRQEGTAPLLEELRRIDPAAAEKLHLKDEKRILRALEVYYETGETMTERNAAEKARAPRYEAVWLGLSYENRDELRARIDRRVDEMVAHGLLDEVRWLLARQLPADATCWQAIGYKQFLSVARGEATAEEAVEEVKLRSRQYAKRQLTWLRRNEAIHWILWNTATDFSAGLQKATEIVCAAGLG